MRLGASLLALLVLGAFPTAAAADPCTAQLPRPGTLFAGQVRYVGDGDSLCVGRTNDPADWIEVRLGDFYAPELREPDGQAAKATLTKIAKGRSVTCRAGRRSYDRVVAWCSLGGVPLGKLMRARGAPEGGNGR